MLKYIFPFVVLLVAVSCSDTKTDETKKTEENTIVKSFKNEADMDNRAVEIDAIISTSELVASSLKYQKNDGSYVQVFGHMNRDNQILKIEEQFSDGDGKSSGSITYYLNGGKPFMTIELVDEVVDGTSTFLDRVSYYDAKGKVLKTKERRSAYQEETETMAYTPVALHKAPIDRAMRALNSEKEFEVTFQGFVYEGAYTYLIVGENSKDNPYTCALRCDYKDPLILQLSSSPDTYMGEKLKISFQIRADQNFEYMVYGGGDFAE